MRAFNLTAPTLDPSYQNAIQAGSLASTGNSFRPIGGPAKYIPQAGAIQPKVGGAPRANPVRVTQGINGATNRVVTAPRVVTPVANPILHAANFRGIIGQ